MKPVRAMGCKKVEILEGSLNFVASMVFPKDKNKLEQLEEIVFPKSVLVVLSVLEGADVGVS